MLLANRFLSIDSVSIFFSFVFLRRFLWFHLRVQFDTDLSFYNATTITSIDSDSLGSFDILDSLAREM